MENIQEHAPPFEESITIQVGEIELVADLRISEDVRGIVAFAHGSGSGRKSPRNRRVAEALEQARFGTLLVDLLTPEEQTLDADTGALRFDIPLLSQRLDGVVQWTDLWKRPIGLYGASTGAAAALNAAADNPELVRAVVSRGGRPDLAMESLPRVRAPTLLIVGERDPLVLELNREALEQIRAPKALEIVPGAGHLFSEPGALDEVARLTAEWFDRHLG